MRHIFLLFVLSATILVLHVAATYFFWYDALFYFDKIMHFLGGAWWGYLFLFVFSDNQKEVSFWDIFLWILVVGVLWEMYEYSYQYYYDTSGIATPIDSLGDIVFDIFGGIMAKASIHLKRFLK